MQCHAATLRSDKEPTQCAHVSDLIGDVRQLTAFIVFIAHLSHTPLSGISTPSKGTLQFSYLFDFFFFLLFFHLQWFLMNDSLHKWDRACVREWVSERCTCSAPCSRSRWELCCGRARHFAAFAVRREINPGRCRSCWQSCWQSRRVCRTARNAAVFFFFLLSSSTVGVAGVYRRHKV